jgi:hypothetical protein
MKEALKLALEAMKYHTAQTRPIHQTNEAIRDIEAALAQPAQEPVMTDEKGRPISFWGGKSLETVAQQAQERNFCSRCGKRTADLTVIHTCTPPQENT